MAIVQFRYPTAAAPTTSWVPSRNHQPGGDELLDYTEQLSQETAGGTLYVQDKGTQRQTFSLRFKALTQADHDNAKTFFNTVKKMLNTFEYVDRNGVNHTVRWVNGFDFIENSFTGQYWDARIELRKEA